MGRGEGKGGQRLVSSQVVSRKTYPVTKDGKISMDEVGVDDDIVVLMSMHVLEMRDNRYECIITHGVFAMDLQVRKHKTPKDAWLVYRNKVRVSACLSAMHIKG